MTGPTSSEPTLSVVTISFRDPDGLARTLDSVARQTYWPIEHIVIDGGSGPAVEALLERAAPTYWQSEPDGGRYDAMNQGIDRVRGDVVWLMHSGDCFADPESAEVAMAALGTAVSGGRASVRDQWGYGRVRVVGDPAREGLIWGYSPFEMRKFALGIRPIPHQATLFGVDLMERIGKYDIDFGLAADHLYMLTAARLQPPVVLEDVLCEFDASGAGSVRPQREHFDDIRRSLDLVGYQPLGRRDLTNAYSRVVEFSAFAKGRIRSWMRGMQSTRVGDRR